jgi:hypothetical protein
VQTTSLASPGHHVTSNLALAGGRRRALTAKLRPEDLIPKLGTGCPVPGVASEILKAMLPEAASGDPRWLQV